MVPFYPSYKAMALFPIQDRFLKTSNDLESETRPWRHAGVIRQETPIVREYKLMMDIPVWTIKHNDNVMPDKSVDSSVNEFTILFLQILLFISIDSQPLFYSNTNYGSDI